MSLVPIKSEYFTNGCFCTGTWVKWVCVWFLWEPFLSSLKTWDPLAFKARCLGGLSLRCRPYRLGCPLLCSHPLLLRRSSWFWVPSQLWVAVPRVEFMASLWLSLFCLDVVFFSFAWCAGIVEPIFRFFFLPGEIIPFVAVDCVSIGGGEFMTFLQLPHDPASFSKFE